METEEGPSIFKLLQPELLSVEELVHILKSVYLLKDVSSLGKVELLEVFKKVAVPQPQRKYSDTYRGKKLTARQQQIESTRKRPCSDPMKIAIPSSNGHNLYKNKTTPSNNERLKPPVDLINYERKKIKLSNKPEDKKSDKNDLDKIVIINRRKSKEECSNIPESESSDLKVKTNFSKNDTEILKSEEKGDESVQSQHIKRKRITYEEKSKEVKVDSLPLKEQPRRSSIERITYDGTSDAPRKIRLKRSFPEPEGSSRTRNVSESSDQKQQCTSDSNVSK